MQNESVSRPDPQSYGRVSISLVVAMYGIADYLPDFLASLEAQDVEGVELECIFVDDGSPDDAAEIASVWMRRTGVAGTVVRKSNGGVSSARNAGLSTATGEWVSFPDPDDALAPGYLRQIADFIAGDLGAQADAVAARPILHIEETGELDDNHPLSYKFTSRQNLSLRRVPHIIQFSCASTFVRRAALQDAGIEFDERLRIGEDALLLSRLFALSDDPHLGVVPQAGYHYRKRAAGNSAIDGADSGALLARYRHGFLPLVNELHAAGRLHEWLAHAILYDLAWPFRQELSVHPMSSGMSASQKAEFLSLVRSVLAHFDPVWIHTAIKPSIPREVRWLWTVLQREGREEPVPAVVAPPRILGLDAGRGLLQVRYLTSKPNVEEIVRVGGAPVPPTHSKTRNVNLFAQQSMFERILWIPATGWIRLEVEGELQPLTYDEPLPRYTAFRADYIAALTAPPPGAQSCDRDAPAAPSWRKRRRYEGAWLFMDRIDMAQDNAEHLYRFVRASRPEINAWFVLSSDSPDWERLKRAGFVLAEYGSAEHLHLLQHAEHVLSSHIDKEISDPLPLSAYQGGRRPWAFTFLQHGVTHNDISHWLNQKDITTLVASTEDEYAALTADLTPYRLTTRETVLTGMPRHDMLLRKVRAHDARGDRNVLLIAPTWRKALVRRAGADPAASDLGESSYIRRWNELLESPQIHDLAAEHGLEMVFLPHPAMREYVGQFRVPQGVTVVAYSDGDIQELLSRSRTLVTDYTSLAFDIAYVGMPTIYYQFDRSEAYSGGHLFLPGYYDYLSDGFGPVCESSDEVSAALRHLHETFRDTGSWPSPYRERMTTTFAHHDGRCSERVLEAVLASRGSQQTVSPPKAALPWRILRGAVRRARSWMRLMSRRRSG